MRVTLFRAWLGLVVLCVAGLQLGSSPPKAVEFSFEFSVTNVSPERLNHVRIVIGKTTLNTDLLPGVRRAQTVFMAGVDPDLVRARWKDRAGERQSHQAPWPRDDAGTPFPRVEIRLGGEAAIEVIGLQADET